MAATKECNTCGETKPVLDFPTKGRSPDGVQMRKAHCKKCECARRKAYSAGAPAPKAGAWKQPGRTKKCRTCQMVLPETSFHLNRQSGKPGTTYRKSDCKACYSAARTGLAAPLDMRRLASAVQTMNENEPAASEHAGDLQAALAAVSMAVNVLTNVLIRRGLA